MAVDAGFATKNALSLRANTQQAKKKQARNWALQLLTIIMNPVTWTSKFQGDEKSEPAAYNLGRLNKQWTGINAYHLRAKKPGSCSRESQDSEKQKNKMLNVSRAEVSK